MALVVNCFLFCLNKFFVLSLLIKTKLVPVADSCGKLVSISEPYTLRGNLGSNGAWMRDPVVSPDFVCYHRYVKDTDP